MAAVNFNIPQDKKMANRFIGKASKRIVKFMDEDLEITKLTINQVLEIQNVTKESAEIENGNILILSAVVRAGAAELRDLDKKDMQDFPMEELAKLSNEIMEFSGLATAAAV